MKCNVHASHLSHHSRTTDQSHPSNFPSHLIPFSINDTCASLSQSSVNLSPEIRFMRFFILPASSTIGGSTILVTRELTNPCDARTHTVVTVAGKWPPTAQLRRRRVGENLRGEKERITEEENEEEEQ